MKNKISKILVSSLLTVLMLSGMVQRTFAASRIYNITYSPGLIGVFEDSLIEDYKKSYGENAVSVSQITGNVTIQVEAQQDMPNAPTAQDITFKEQSQENRYYVLTSGWQPASTTVSENATFVVQYGALVNSVEYSIRYVDKTTNQDVATPIIAKANQDELMSAYAKVIEGYTFDVQSKTLTLTGHGKQNVITFYYTQDEKTVVVDEVVDNIVTRNQLTTIPTRPTTIGTPSTTIPDNRTPLIDSGTINADQSNTTIQDNETPLSKADDLTKNNQILFYSIGIVSAILIIGVVIVIVKKREKA